MSRINGSFGDLAAKHGLKILEYPQSVRRHSRLNRKIHGTAGDCRQLGLTANTEATMDGFSVKSLRICLLYTSPSPRDVEAIEEMCFAEETLTVKQAKALYDAGYRRQEEGK